ncbi:hypothetical protein Tco_0674140 [Tanacetum coccineum]
MMLPNALFDAADLFVAAINGVWRWWSVGDVGDLTWVVCFVLGICMVVALCFYANAGLLPWFGILPIHCFECLEYGWYVAPGMLRQDAILILSRKNSRETTVYNIVMRYLGVLRLESEGDHVHLAIGKFSGKIKCGYCRCNYFEALTVLLFADEDLEIPYSYRDASRTSPSDAGMLYFSLNWTCYTGIDFKCGDWKMGKLGMRSGMAGIRIRDNLGAGEWKWKEYSGSCDAEGGLDDSWRLSVLKL